MKCERSTKMYDTDISVWYIAEHSFFLKNETWEKIHNLQLIVCKILYEFTLMKKYNTFDFDYLSVWELGNISL